jgi:hypothetical protein
MMSTMQTVKKGTQHRATTRQRQRDEQTPPGTPNLNQYERARNEGGRYPPAKPKKCGKSGA